MRNDKTQRNFLIIEIATIVILGLIPLLWFKSGFVIKSDDFDLPVNFQRLYYYFFSWNPLRGAGAAPLDNYPALFFFFVQAFLSKINPSFIFVEKLQFIFWFMLPGFSIGFLMRELIKESRLRLAVTIGIVIYMVNFYLESVWQGFNIANLSVYSLSPLMLTVFIKGLNRQMGFLRCIFLFGFISLAASGMGVNPPMLVLFFFILVTFFIYHILFIRRPASSKQFIFLIAYLFIIFFVFVLINAYWVLPAVGKIFDSGIRNPLEAYQASALGWLRGVCANTSALNVLRMQGAWTWYEAWKLEPYVPYSSYFQKNPLFIIYSFIAPFLAFLAIFFFRKNRYVFYFAGLALFGTFFGMGIHKPFGFLYVWLIKYIPGFWSFRSPWYKFTLLTCLGYSFLIAISLASIYNLLKERLSRKCSMIIPAFLIIFVLGCYLIYSFPLINGAIFPDAGQRKYLASYHAKVPDYAYQAADFFNRQQGEWRIMVLPNKHLRVTEWGYIGYAPLIGYLINRPVITHHYISDNLSRFAYEYFYRMKKDDVFSYVLSLLNVRFILQENDIKLKFYQGTDNIDYDDPEFIKERLGLCGNIALKESFGEWDVYEVDKYLPRIFMISEKALKNKSDSLIYHKIQELNEYMDVYEGIGQRRDFSINIKDKYIEPEGIALSNVDKIITEVNYKRINPTKYIIKVKDNMDPFYLVFLESYDPRWQALLQVKDKKDSGLKGLSSRKLKDHIVINSYANGWYVDLSKYTDLQSNKDSNLSRQDIEIVLDYKPQKIFNIALIISFTTVVIGLIVFLNPVSRRVLF